LQAQVFYFTIVKAGICSVPCFRNHLVDQERIRPIGDFPWLASLFWVSFSVLTLAH